MSESQTTLRERVIKFGTWLFLVFIFAIIVISFGMPDVIGTSSRIDAYNAAKIDGEYLTKAEVSEYQKRLEERMMQNMKNVDAKTRKMLDDMTRGRALDEAIEGKLYRQVLARAGYTPTSSSEPKILANFYKKQFSDYIVNGRLDKERLNEFLSQRRLTLDQIGQGWLRDYGPSRASEMLQGTTYASDFAILDDVRFASTQNSYQIVGFDQGTRDKALRAKFVATEADIQNKFKTEFLSKDPKAVLDAAKRETIKATLFNEKKAALEKEFMQTLTTAARSGIAQVAAAGGTKVISIADAGLNTDLDSKKGKDFAALSLSALSQSDVFVKQRLSAPLGQVIGPVDAGGFTYFFTVTARKSATLPQGNAYSKLEKSAKDELAKTKDLPKDVSYDKTWESTSRTNYASVLTAALELHRGSVRIIRYNKQAAGQGGAD